MFKAVTDIDDRSKTLGDFLREVQAMHEYFEAFWQYQGKPVLYCSSFFLVIMNVERFRENEQLVNA